MKKINATRDEIVKMLQSGEIVFAAYRENHFSFGRGIIIHNKKPAYALESKERFDDLVDYGRGGTEWYVDYAKPFEFRVGDICEFGGVEGVIEEVSTRDGLVFPLTWKAHKEEYSHSVGFTKDGRLFPWTTKPLLNFIRRPKKKVKKTIEIVTWVIASESGALVGVYDKVPDFGMHPNWKLLKSIATTEIEVEEE